VPLCGDGTALAQDLAALGDRERTPSTAAVRGAACSPCANHTEQEHAIEMVEKGLRVGETNPSGRRAFSWRALGVAGALWWMAGCAHTNAAAPRVMPHRASGPTRLLLPPPGRVHADQLVDGDPVWVVRMHDQVRVLSALARVENQGRDQRVLVSFDPGCQCFRGDAPVVWDPNGAILARTTPDYTHWPLASGIGRSYDNATAFRLDRYDVTQDGEHVVVGTRWSADEYARPHERLASTVVDAPGPQMECPIMPHELLVTALRRPEGTLLALDVGAIYDPVHARVCETDFPPYSSLACDRATAPAYAADGTRARGESWPRPMVVRRYRDGFMFVASGCRQIGGLCDGPLHDRAWLRTPIGEASGVSIDAPEACPGRPSSSIRMIRVHGHGSRGVILADRGTEASPACASPGSSRVDCPEVPAVAMFQTLGRALSAREMSLGIGGCFSASVRGLETRAVIIHDWRSADEAIRIVQTELDRWDLNVSLWVSIEPMFCMSLAGLTRLGS
jgi:hypothetical protein